MATCGAVPPSGCGIVEREAPRLHLRVGEHRGEVVDRAAGHGGRLECGDPLGGGAHHRRLAQQRDQFLALGDARRVGREAFVVGPFRMAGDGAEAGELAVVADGQDHVAVGGREILVGHDVGVGVAHAPRRRAGNQVVQRLVGQAGDLHVEQRQVDVLALAAAQTVAVAVGEGGEDGVAGVEAGQDVGQRDADLLRPGARLAFGHAGQAHQPAHALDQEVVAGARRVRAVLAEAGDRAIDQLAG